MKSFYFLIILLVTSCTMVLDDVAPQDNGSGVGFESLLVADGFDYKSTRMQAVTIMPASKSGAFYEVFALGGDTILLSNGYLSKGQPLSREFEVGNHITDFMIKLQENGRVYTRQFSKESDINFNVASMNESISGARIEKNNCLPTLVGVDWELWKTENSVIIVSTADKAISNVVFNINNQDHFKVEDPRLYNGIIKETSWELPVSAFQFTIEDIEGIWVKSGCNKSGDGPGYGEYIINPYFDHMDADGDSIPDILDVNTSDLKVAAIEYFPSKEQYWTYAFEDKWPNKADYDFNDLVVYYNYEIMIDDDDMVRRFAYHLQVAAIGATYDNDFSLSFSGDNTTTSLSETNHHGLEYEILSNGEFVELKFKHIKDLYPNTGFVNTDSTKAYIEPKELTGIVELGAGVKVSEFKLEAFIHVNQQPGREVHMADYAGSINMDQSLYGSGNDDSQPENGKYFKTKENHPWAINVPVKWEYPAEHADVTQAYIRFADYATYEPLIDWYSRSEKNQNRKKVFKRGRGSK